jgi:hypothetical protein
MIRRQITTHREIITGPEITMDHEITTGPEITMGGAITMWREITMAPEIMMHGEIIMMLRSQQTTAMGHGMDAPQTGLYRAASVSRTLDHVRSEGRFSVRGLDSPAAWRCSPPSAPEH